MKKITQKFNIVLPIQVDEKDIENKYIDLALK
jgi:hypothetical protein